MRWWHRAGFLLAAGLGIPSASAENIDPADDGSRYAYSENAGWINARPLGPGGPGMHVSDFELTGWAWSENLGWINFSCRNTDSCGTVAFGVTNDGAGGLAGYAWAENAGWVNFAPAFGGVTIDPASGEFAGRAWSENVGWITFAASDPVAFWVTTSWRCDPLPAPPPGVPELTVEKSGDGAILSWTATGGASGADVVRGSISALMSSDGDFTLATEECLRNDDPGSTLGHDPTPASGQGYWYLVRPVNCGGAGTHDSGGPGQSGSRDAEVAASAGACL